MQQDENPSAGRVRHGLLALDTLGKYLPLRVLESGAGFYLGTADEDGPATRESAEYWPTFDAAHEALQHPAGKAWTQRTEA